MPSYETDTFRIELADSWLDAMTFKDVLANQRLIHFEFEARPDIPTGAIFQVYAPGFRFICGFEDGHFFLVRNAWICKLDMRRLKGFGQSHFYAYWGLEGLAIKVVSQQPLGDLDEAICSIAEPMQPTPQDLVNWCIREHLHPRNVYPDRLAFRGAVRDMLHRAEENIVNSGAARTFWNETSDGRMPKREPEVTAALHALMQDQALMAGVELTQQVGAAGGSADFLFVGGVLGNSRDRVIVEAKAFNSPRLFHGIDVQLPAYMTAMMAGFGIYLVLLFDASHETPKGQRRMVDLHARSSQSRQIQFMNLSIAQPPSRA